MGKLISEEKGKIVVHYATEFGSRTTILELDKLLSFTKRFKVLSLNWK